MPRVLRWIPPHSFPKGLQRRGWGLAKALQWPESIPLPWLPPHLALHHSGSFRSTFLSQGLPETPLISLQGWQIL